MHIGGLIRRLDMLNLRSHDTLIDRRGLTPPQINALNALYEMHQEGLTPNQRMLEKRLYLTNPTVTGLLGRLEAKGMIERVRDDQDARSKRIVLTPKGIDCRQSVHASLETTEARLTACLSEREREQMEEMLIRMIGCLEKTEEDERE